MKKTIKISVSPFSPNIEVVGDKIFSIDIPSSDKTATLKINPAISDYVENNDQPGVKVRNVLEKTSTDETISLTFDFDKNSSHEITINGDPHIIKFMHADLEEIDGQKFPYFEFFIEENPDKHQ